jgi:hypothetical protein
MATFHLPTGALRTLAVVSLTACLSLLTLGVAAVAAASSSHGPRVLAGARRAVPRSLAVAARRGASAERALVADAKRLKRCAEAHNTSPKACAAARRALRRAGSKLREAELRLSRVARDSAGTTIGVITYPSSSPPPAKEHEATPPQETGSAPFEMGVVMGSAELYELPWAVTLKSATARLEFAIDDPVSMLEPIVEAYAKDGIRPLLLAGFNARVPSVAEAENVAKWAAAFGPGGTFWQGKGKGLPADTAVTDIEFGNETNNPYQFSPTLPYEWQNQPEYLQRAEEYARRLQAASIAVSATGAKVGLLGIADQGNGYTTWVGAMFKAVPNLWQYVAGWTVHPYGPEWHVNMDAMVADTAAHGAPSTIPIYVTEWGLNSDNGRCLVDNMGWNPCMTYAEAATDLGATIGGMRSRYGSRLRAVYLFQARDQKATGTSTEFEGYYGALQSDMAPKGAYTTEVESLLSANP